jgi:hypothetical protein
MPIRWAYLKRVLAGAIFGLYIAHLLYFLNPQVDVTPARLALVTMLYGVACGVIFGTALWILRAVRVRLFGKPVDDGTYRAHGFGFVVFAAFVSAAIYWMQRTVFWIYLPIGMQRGLTKSTNLITAVAFALLILWIFERNASQRQSRIIFVTGVVLVVISSVFLYERRDDYRTAPQRVVVANVGTIAGQRPLLVVAIRNLPYDWIVTLAGEGGLPFFEHARASSFFTRLEPFPVTSPQALWASLATGKLPFRHGVTGEYSYSSVLNGFDRREPIVILPTGIGFHSWALIPPVTLVTPQLPSGNALPMWAVFQRVGLKTAVIDWPNAPGVIPADVMTRAAAQPSTIARFNSARDALPRIQRGLNADAVAVASLATAAGRPDLKLAVATLRGFEEAQRAIHIFSNELPPRTTVKGETARAYVEQIDAALGTIARLFPDHVLVVVSPSGPVAPRLPNTPLALFRDFVLADDPGVDDGFVLMTGPGIVHREKPAAAQAVDVVPTCLYAAGLPVARDMDGRVLTDAFADELLRTQPLALLPTYEAGQLLVRHVP